MQATANTPMSAVTTLPMFAVWATRVRNTPTRYTKKVTTQAVSVWKPRANAVHFSERISRCMAAMAAAQGINKSENTIMAYAAAEEYTSRSASNKPSRPVLYKMASVLTMDSRQSSR